MMKVIKFIGKDEEKQRRLCKPMLSVEPHYCQ